MENKSLFRPPRIQNIKEVDFVESSFRAQKNKRFVKISLLIFFLAYLYFHYFVYWDPGENCYIKIKPALLEFSNLGMKRALRTLKNVSPDDYSTVCKNVSVIEPFIGCGGFGGGCYYTKKDAPQSSSGSEIVVSTSKDDLVTTVAVILHETCHAIQNREGRPLNEIECYKLDDDLLRRMVNF